MMCQCIYSENGILLWVWKMRLSLEVVCRSWWRKYPLINLHLSSYINNKAVIIRVLEHKITFSLNNVLRNWHFSFAFLRRFPSCRNGAINSSCALPKPCANTFCQIDENVLRNYREREWEANNNESLVCLLQYFNIKAKT